MAFGPTAMLASVAGCLENSHAVLLQDFLGLEAFQDVPPVELVDGSFLWVRRFESPAGIPDHLLVFE